MPRPVRRDTAEFLMGEAPNHELLDAARRLVDRGRYELSLDAAEEIADAIEYRAPNAAVDLAESCGSGVGVAHEFLAARLAQVAGRDDEASNRLSYAISLAGRPEPSLLGLRARWYARAGRFEEAAADLRLALETAPSYAFYLRTERLVDRVLRSPWQHGRRRVKLAWLAGSTTALTAPVLRAAFLKRGMVLDVHVPQFAAHRQEILDGSSALYRFQPEVAVFVANQREVDLPPSGGWSLAADVCHEFEELWQALAEKAPCRIVQVGFSTVASGAWGALEDLLPQGRRRVLRQANEFLVTKLPAGATFLDIDALSASAATAPDSPREWNEVKQFPGSTLLPFLADGVCAAARGLLGLSAKVLALDLDNTLWAGVVGEDGVAGIQVGPPTALGEAHAEIQKYALELKRRGVVLAVCSKNNPADARQPFQERDGMVLSLDDVVAFNAGWEDKAASLRAIAMELSLGLDSFVFLDDNPVERAWVRSQLPEVMVPEAGSDPWDMLAALRRGMYFETGTLTNEDLTRHESYVATRAIRAVAADDAALERFLMGLDMHASYGPVDDQTLPRVAQLINKTNQFNLTTRRYSLEEVRALARDPHVWAHWFRLTDRHGDHGLVGVMIARSRGREWDIDSWLMSCRVLGRRMEDFMCSKLLAAASQAGASRVVGEYLPTPKNGLVADLYPRLGFAPSPDGKFSLALAEHGALDCPWIYDDTAPNETSPVDLTGHTGVGPGQAAN